MSPHEISRLQASDSAHPTPANPANALESAGELRVLLLHLQLRPRSLGVGQRVHDLALRPGELCRALEVLQRFGHLALLQQQLGHGCDSNITLGVNWER